MYEWLKKFYSENRKILFMMAIAILILMSLGVVHAECNETWIMNNTECNGFNYTIQYYDEQNCNTTLLLPLINGTIVDCQCVEYWSKNINPCVNGVTLIEYTDMNNCNTTALLPITNNTNDYCMSYVQKEYGEDIIILSILFLFMIVSTILAISVHEAFFGLNALLVGLMIVVFIQYDYPTILYIASAVIIIAFTIMWVIMNKMRR
jgi:hypothetical protein